PNGAGKTTLINILTGLQTPDSGSILYHGETFNPESLPRKRLLGVVPQNNNIERDLSVEDNLKIHGFLFGMGKQALADKIAEVLDIVDLSEQRYKIASELSGGMKRRLVIARALLHDPQILFLDEPSTGLDPSTRRKIHDLIRRLNRNAGVSVFLTTHYIEEADMLSSRVVLINQGRIAASGTPEQLKSGIGKYALEYTGGEELQIQYFNDRDAAMSAAQSCGQNIRIRDVTLEDAYIKLTGRKIGG
ncbi:ABC transporter ATP-binding protein, partial [Desulfovibrio sp. OttesenSCG-928-C06]|nr:ABC transporter ATP-binding protein [Desulfovibrio sp. OttesenSCG-928-C06]